VQFPSFAMNASRSSLLASLATLVLHACGRPPVPVVQAPDQPRAATAPQVATPYTLADLKTLGQRELDAVELEISNAYTPLRELDDGVYADGDCQEPSADERTKALDAVKVWNLARVLAERAKSASALPAPARASEALPEPKDAAFGCMDNGEVLAKFSSYEAGVKVDLLVRIGRGGVRELHRVMGPPTDSVHEEGAAIATVLVDEMRAGQSSRDLVLRILKYDESMSRPSSLEWWLIRNERTAVRIASEYSMSACDSEGLPLVPVKWRSQLAIACQPEKFFQAGQWGRLLPSMKSLSHADEASTASVNRLLWRQAAATELASLASLPIKPADRAKTRLALGALGHGTSALLRMGVPQHDELAAANQLWIAELTQHPQPHSNSDVPKYPLAPLSRENKQRIVRDLATNDAARAANLVQEVGRDARCKFTLNANSVVGLQWQSPNGTGANVRWTLAGTAACRLPEKHVLNREGIYQLSGSVSLLASAADSTRWARDTSDGQSETLFGWSLRDQNAYLEGGVLWALSRDTRALPASKAYDVLRADAADGRSALLPVKGRTREVGFRAYGGKLYAVDGVKLHVFQNGAWLRASVDDAFATELSDRWERNDLVRTLPKAPDGMSLDDAYARLGVSVSERAAFFAPVLLAPVNSRAGVRAPRTPQCAMHAIGR
jgi:hypothetical protein